MANISLREYIRKIENLIENGEIDQAIAHCKHILEIYPKHIDSYRLLGKALLEKQKYGDASDIFQRVLSSVPDDFISQIGMSIIREDENNLDAAIWHMERAFEVQPSNKAVQDELRRLYTNRDGVAPPKIRLTRGALVRMYTRGELFNQAIAEIWAALEEDPNRVDLEVILARIYYQLGQKVEATETCSKLISKLPYCYEANKILTEILPGTAREEDEKVFRQRVIDLDPYFQLTDDRTILTSEVSDSKIMVEYLEWDPMSAPFEQPDWVQSIGLALDSDKSLEEDVVNWLEESDDVSSEPKKSVEEVYSISDVNEDEINNDILNLKDSKEDREDDQIDITDELTSASPIAEEEIGSIPDWIKDAGWEVASESGESIEKGFNISLPNTDEPEDSEKLRDIEDEIEPAEIPDWLREIAPKDENVEEDDEEEFEIKNLEELFDKIEPANLNSEINNSDIQWKNEFQEENEFPIEIDPDQSEQVILPEDATEEGNLRSEDEISPIPNLNLEDETSTFDFESISELTKENIFEEIPDSIKFEEIFANEENESSDLSEIDDDWLSSLIVEVEIEGDSVDFLGEAEDKEGVPDWIKSVIDEEDHQLPSSEEKAEENLPDWLSSTDQDTDLIIDDIKITFDESESQLLDNNFIEIKSEELLDDAEDAEDNEEKLAEESLSLLENQIFNAEKELNFDDEIHIEETPQSEVQDFETEQEEKQMDSESESNDLESALAWMEGLAIKHGADEETMISKPEERLESPPDWISEETKLSEEISDDFDSTPSWLRDLEIETSDVVIEGKDELETDFDEFKDFSSELEIEESEDLKLEFLDKFISKDTKETFSESADIEDTSEVQESSEFPESISEIEESVNELDFTELRNEITESTTSEEVDEFLGSKLDEEQMDVEEPILVDELIDDGMVGDEPILVDDLIEDGMVEDEPILVDELIEDVKEEDEPILVDELIEDVKEEDEPILVDEFNDDLRVEDESMIDSDSNIQVSTTELLDEEPQVVEVEEEMVPDLVQSARIENLEEAKKLLYSGNIDQSINIYNNFIKEGHHLDDVIQDIQSALDHQFPIDINLWQALGDAYLKDKQLQNALDAYSKAEDLLS
jgi:hypothetical protein